MILNKRFPYLLFIALVNISCSTQSVVLDTSNSEEFIINENNEGLNTTELVFKSDTVFIETIRTALLYNSTFELSDPIINLSSEEQLTLKFDDLGDDLVFYTYNIIKCDKNWNESTDSQMKYIDGFIDNTLTNYEYSHSTLTEYTHYELSFPDYGDYKISQSGNYIIEIRTDDSLVLNKRFQVVEQLCSINPSVKKASDIMDANYRQEIDFNIETDQTIQNPIKNITVHLYKNGNAHDIRKDLKPKFVDGNILKYDYDNSNVFDGGNEFRPLNLKSNRLLLQYVKDVKKVGDDFYVYLHQDKAKTYKTYSFKEDLNGKFMILNEDRAESSHLSTEYFNVFFSLNYGKPLAEGDFYIYGGISNWKIDERFKLSYNSTENIFEQNVFLKQGFYDYEYLYVKDGKTDESMVEGTHFATQNNYTIQVYWTDNFGEERLIGHKTFSAH